MRPQTIASIDPWRPFSEPEIRSFIKDNQEELRNPHLSWGVKEAIALENVLWWRLIAAQEDVKGGINGN